MPWTTEQKIFIVEAYFRQKSIHAAQLQFKERFGYCEFPVHWMINRWVNKFRTHGTVHNLNRKDANRQSHSGRPKSRTPHNVAAVRDSVVHSPRTTTSGLWQSPSDMSTCLASSGQHLVDGEGSVRVLQWLHQDGATPTPQTNHWHGYTSVSLTDWSAEVWPVLVTAFTRLEHSRFSNVRIPQGLGVWQQTPDYPWPECNNHSSNKSDPKEGMREGHWELCLPDPNVPVALWSLFGQHFFELQRNKEFL